MAAPYADFYLLPLKKKLLPKYKRIAQRAGRLWRKHGALEYREFVADDLSAKWGTWPMGKVMKVKKGEVLIGSIVGYKSRKHRDATNQKVMQDPKMGEIMYMMPMTRCSPRSWPCFSIPTGLISSGPSFPGSSECCVTRSCACTGHPVAGASRLYRPPMTARRFWTTRTCAGRLRSCPSRTARQVYCAGATG